MFKNGTPKNLAMAVENALSESKEDGLSVHEAILQCVKERLAQDFSIAMIKADKAQGDAIQSLWERIFPLQIPPNVKKLFVPERRVNRIVCDCNVLTLKYGGCTCYTKD